MAQHETALTCCYVRGRINVCLRFGESSRRQSGDGLITYWFALRADGSASPGGLVSRPAARSPASPSPKRSTPGTGGFRLPGIDQCRCGPCLSSTAVAWARTAAWSGGLSN